MQVLASKVRKGQKIWLGGVKVLVTRREKWNSYLIKISYTDCGQGLPYQSGLSKVYAGFQSAEFLKHTDLLEVG